MPKSFGASKTKKLDTSSFSLSDFAELQLFQYVQHAMGPTVQHFKLSFFQHFKIFNSSTFDVSTVQLVFCFLFFQVELEQMYSTRKVEMLKVENVENVEKLKVEMLKC